MRMRVCVFVSYICILICVYMYVYAYVYNNINIHYYFCIKIKKMHMNIHIYSCLCMIIWDECNNFHFLFTLFTGKYFTGKSSNILLGCDDDVFLHLFNYAFDLQFLLKCTDFRSF